MPSIQRSLGRTFSWTSAPRAWMQYSRGKSANWSLSRRRATRIQSLQRKNVFEVRFLMLLLTLPRYGEWMHKNPEGGHMQRLIDRSRPNATHAIRSLPMQVALPAQAAFAHCTMCYCVAGRVREHSYTARRSCSAQEAGQHSFRRAKHSVKKTRGAGDIHGKRAIVRRVSVLQRGSRDGTWRHAYIECPIECPTVQQCPTAQEMHHPCSWLSQHQRQGSYYAPTLTCLDAAGAESAPSGARRGPSHRQQHQQQRQRGQQLQ